MKSTTYFKLAPDWLFNPVLVKKNGNWRVCIDFTNLNKTCLTDNYPLLMIDQLVKAIAGHELLSFMDAYTIYNQIKMHPPDEDKIAFTTGQEIYCYKGMPFGVKAEATFQRMDNKVFKDQIGSTVEVYVNDMLVKSVQRTNRLQHLDKAFDLLRQYKVKLNPKKCTFRVASGKFSGYLVTQGGIEADPD